MFKQILKRILFPLFLFFFFALIFNAYYQRIGAFGCFDDCFNYVAAYFMLKGKTLYSEIFFNHQPLMAVISYLIQKLSQPETIYQLVLFHRLFVFLFSFLMDIFLIFRFRWAGVGFVLFYETTKYYLFGDRFLAEGLIVYPLAYLLGLLWYKWQKKKIFALEFILSAIFTWFIIFSRASYTPVALLLYGLLLWKRRFSRAKSLSLYIFLLLSFITLLSFPLSDYFFNVFKANLGRVTFDFRSFVYPLYLLTSGNWSFFKIILTSLDIIFLILIGFFAFRLKKYQQIGFILLILALANLRAIPAGKIFYEAFHLLSWYALLIIALFLMLESLYNLQNKRKLTYPLIFLLVFLFGYASLSPQSFLYEKVDKEREFTTNYAQYFVNGETIKILADPDDTLFVEKWDDLIYWQADLPSSYKYSWFTSFMPFIPLYSKAREEMFLKNPPDFYYGDCPKEKFSAQSLPKYRVEDYVQLYFAEKPSCLYIKKTKLSQISADRWEKVKKFGFYLP